MKKILNNPEFVPKDKRVVKLISDAKDFFTSAKGCHDWDHTERVLNLCLHIGEKEHADMKILIAAAVLHDIGREEEEKKNRKICHAEYGAKLAKKILAKHQYQDLEIEKIIYCIRSHRFKNKNIPESLEAKVLYDADKIDAIGAIGIGRAFVFSGEIGARVHHPSITLENSTEYSKDDTAYRHFLDKLSKVKDRLLTSEGRRMAKKRHDFMIKYFLRLDEETQGVL